VGDAAAGIATAALFLAAGWGWTEIAASLRRLPLAARLGWAYLLGMAWVAGGGFALSWAQVATLRTATFAALAAVPVVVGAAARLRRARGQAERVRRPRRMSPLVLGCAALGAAACAGVAARMTSEPISDWDGRMTWAPAARWICAEGTVNPRALRQGRWSVSHPDYPLLVPVADCVALGLGSGEEGAEPFRLLYALQLPALLAVVWTGAARWAGRRAAWLTAAILAVAPFPVWNPDGGATGAYSDLALAGLFGGGVILLVRPREWRQGLLGGLLLAAAAMTKNEGAWIGGGAIAVCAFTARLGSRGARRQGRQGWLVGLLLLGLSIVIAQSWAAGIPARGDESYSVLAGRLDLAAALDGARRSAAEALRQMAAPSSWSLFWWIVPALLILGRQGWLRRRFSPLAIAAALPLALGAAAYALHPDPERLVAVTWNRFLVQGLVPLGILLALALRSSLRREPAA
jgi:hypothetical protein